MYKTRLVPCEYHSVGYYSKYSYDNHRFRSYTRLTTCSSLLAHNDITDLCYLNRYLYTMIM